MANTYSQLYAQIVFSPQGRENLIRERIKADVYKYITGIIKNKNQKLMIINGMPDHIHILIGFAPEITLSDIVRDIKSNSSNYINERRLVAGKFSWQKGFGAFTYGKSQVQSVIDYIKNQEKHHRRKTFREEYQELLKRFCVEYNNEYLFEWYD